MIKNSRIYSKLKVKSPKPSNFRQIHYSQKPEKRPKKACSSLAYNVYLRVFQKCEYFVDFSLDQVRGLLYRLVAILGLLCGGGLWGSSGGCSVASCGSL